MLREGSYLPVYYFPRGSVVMKHLKPTTHHSHCPFKGTASYWSIETGENEIPNSAWSYQEPIESVAAIKDHIAFYWDAIEEWRADDLVIDEPQ